MENNLQRRNDRGVNSDLGLIDPFFRDLFGTQFYFDKKNHQIMKTDVKENEHDYELSVEVPGIEKENISLALDDGYLTISAHKESNEETKDHKDRYLRKERFSGSYQRSFYVGDVDQESINAKMENGVLIINVPKETEKDKSKKFIDIK